jgi:CHAT domain-containing protein
VLIVMANPRGTSLLDLQAEREKIEKSLSQIEGIRIVVVERATLRELRLRLREGRFHIVHFMGHGVGFDEESGEGALLLETREGEAVLLSATELAEFFEGLEAPRLVVLNACKTAVTSETVDPVQSVAASLVVAGLPAVLAQRAAIQDDAALIVAEELYRRLAQDDPIEAAVAEARLALRSERRGTADWAIPALFVRPGPADTRLPQTEAPVTEKPPQSPARELIVRARTVHEQWNIQADNVHVHGED